MELNHLNKQHVLGRTNRLLPDTTWTAQKTKPLILRCHGDVHVFIKPLFSNDRGTQTDSLSRLI
jgi:hypothetical protein